MNIRKLTADIIRLFDVNTQATLFRRIDDIEHTIFLAQEEDLRGATRLRMALEGTMKASEKSEWNAPAIHSDSFAHFKD